MEITIELDKENSVFLNKSIIITKIDVDNNGYLILEGQDGKVKMSFYDLMQVLNGLLPKLVNMFGGSSI